MSNYLQLSLSYINRTDGIRFDTRDAMPLTALYLGDGYTQQGLVSLVLVVDGIDGGCCRVNSG